MKFAEGTHKRVPVYSVPVPHTHAPSLHAVEAPDDLELQPEIAEEIGRTR